MLPLRDNVPTRRFPVVTVGLIAVNLAVWGWELHGTPVQADLYRYGYYPCSESGPCLGPAVGHLPWWQGIFTGMFVHASWEHVLFNMLFLWIFGNNVEDALGPARFLIWYLLAGIAAIELQTLVTLRYAPAVDASIPNIGASGAIAGVLGAYLLLLPNAKVLTWVLLWLREIPAYWFLLVWFGLQLYLGGTALEHPQAGGGTAFFAHLGGFAFGVATVHLFAVRRPLRPRY